MIKEETRRSFKFNLLIVLLLCAVLYVLFFVMLGFITRHNSEIKVPNVLGRDVKMAVKELERMEFEVDIDSAYDPKQRPYIVLAQQPDINATVKNGRTVFLTINKAEAPKTAMPNLLNLSFRSAEMILKSNKLLLGDTSYKPDIAKGAILEQMYKGKPIRPGEMIPQGSRVDLIIGDGLGNIEFNVPDVIGMSYDEAIAILSSTGLQFTPIWEGGITDSASAVIYDQYPKAINELMAPNRIKEGDVIDIHVKQTASEDELQYNRNGSRGVDNEKEQ
jgi:eukaryotic-like serine/threonine-protein kinase